MIRAGLKVLLISALLVATAAPALAEKRLALVIGNSRYLHTQQLRNPEHDARLIAAILSRQGFEVLLHTNLDFKAMKRAVQDYTSRLEQHGKDTVGLLYFAGHGLQSEGQNFLVPVDAKIDKDGDIDIETISSDSILTGVRLAGNRLNIVVLDACRNNPYRGSFRSVGRGFARMDAPVGSLVAFATSPGTVAADGDGANSPYTAALAKALVEPGLKLEDVFKRVRLEVHAATRGAQVPWESSSVFDDFYFVPRKQDVASPAATPPPAVDARAIELAYWNSIKDTESRSAFEAYLSQFPDGEFASLARVRIAELTPAAPAASAETRRLPSPASEQDFELAYWNSIGDSGNPAEFESYLKQFPNGRFAALARLRIEALKKQPQVAALPPAAAPVLAPSARKAPFDGIWFIKSVNPGCNAELLEFILTVEDGKASWPRGSGAIARDGSLSLTSDPVEGRKGVLSGTIKGDSGKGIFTGYRPNGTVGCTGSFTITRRN